MLVLFVDFYIKTYIKKPKEQLKAQMNDTKANNQNNDKRNNDFTNNEIQKDKSTNGIKKSNDKDTNEAKVYLKSNLSKLVNGNDVSYTDKNNDFRENVNYFENGIEKSTCGSGKCKINCHKHYKNE